MAGTRFVSAWFRDGVKDGLAAITLFKSSARMGTRESDAERLAESPATMLSDGVRDSDVETRLVRA